MKKLWAILLTLVLVVGLISPATTIVYAESVVAMTVNGTEYTDHGTGWSDAIKLSKSGTETTVKLFADWIADAEKGFVCPDGGTKDGALHVGSGKIILDLNGYTLDRNADKNAASYASSVLYVNDCTFTLVDTSAEKKGKITGGYAQYGGGIYAEDANLYINSGNITGNRAKEGGGVYSWEDNMVINGGCISHNTAENGGGLHTYNTKFDMNDGSITDNEATLGGGAYVSFSVSTIYGGVIARNRAATNGGGVMVVAKGFSNCTKLVLRGGVIEENYADGEGGAIYFDPSTDYDMYGGTLRNNTAYSHGGAIFCYYDTDDNNTYTNMNLYGGSIIGNVSQTGNGGGVYWDENSSLQVADCTITENSAPKGYGGGVYFHSKATYLVLHGTVIITDNTAFTDRSDSVSNVFADSDSDLRILQDTDGRTLNADSKIGLSCGSMSSDTLTDDYGKDANLTSEMADCFFSDDPSYVIAKKQDGEHYDIYFEENPNPTFSGDPLLAVETQDEGKKDFFDHREGWYYALEKSKTVNVKITLYDHWIGGGGEFKFYEKGTHDGSLYLNGDCKNDITIDLNGYNIDRNMQAERYGGHVFYLNTYGSLTIIDSSEAKTGTITGAHNIGNGGAFYNIYGSLYLKGGSVTGNSASYGGAIYSDNQDDAFVYIQDGTRIYDNSASSDGGGIYMNNGYLYVDGGEITGNSANKGAGVHWASNNKGYFTGGKIYGNTAKKNGGGVYVADYGKIFVGGDVQITDNEVGNLYISNKDRNIHNACGQDGSPNKPLTEGAIIGISASDSDDLISGDNSRFKEGDYKYFFTDSSAHYIRAVYDATNTNHAHKLYINSLTNADVRYPRVKTVSVKDSNLLESAVLDYDTQTITLTAHNTRRNFFERACLSELIECTYDAEADYIYEMDYMRDLRNVQEYKVMSDNGTYTLCTVEVVPEGGKWADEQESVDNPYKMTVAVGSSVIGFTDLGEGWVYATSQTLPATVTLFADWIAPDGKFNYSSGTDKGRLYVNGNKNITIDLNGNNIDRNLESAISDGQVFKIAGSAKLTITDTVGADVGKITGGNNNGNGGAFYIDGGSLYINGGEISGNYATNGGAVYWYSSGTLCITGGVITNNLAKDNGGAVYITNNGKVYFGGTAVITNSSRGNVYISNKDANIYHARGQADGVPDMPLKDGASIGIYASDSDDTISGDNSRFGEDDYKYFFSDSTDHYIRAVYKEADGNHAHKLYLNSLKNSDAKFPLIQAVSVKNSELLQNAAVNNDTKVITLTGYANKKDSFKQVSLDSLINYTTNRDVTYINGAKSAYDLSLPVKYKVMNENGTYVLYTVKTQWVCTQHEDANGDCVCDYCAEYVLTDFTVVNYNAQTKQATVFATQSGRYTLVFAKYQNNNLSNVDIVEYDFKKGVNVVSQQVTDFALATGDKVMLWYSSYAHVPVCGALTLK